MKKILFIFLITLIIGSCINSNKESKNHNENFQEQVLGSIIGSGRLKLTASFNECGEWGGHYEKIDIYSEENNLYAEYIRDTVDCEKLHSINRKEIQKKILKLNETHEKAISEYLKSLLEMRLKINVPCNFGITYKAIMSDSTLMIEHSCAKKDWSEFEKLKRQLQKNYLQH